MSMLYIFGYSVFFSFKQKTAYEVRISDWSSDVCSSDLQAFEPVGPVARDPVHHIAAIAGAQRAAIAGIDLRILGGGGGQPQFQILQRLAAPIFVDAVGEGLAVARRTVEIDDHRSIAMGRERLGIPAIGPAIAEAALRPAMAQPGYHSEERRGGKEGVGR